MTFNRASNPFLIDTYMNSRTTLRQARGGVQVHVPTLSIIREQNDAMERADWCTRGREAKKAGAAARNVPLPPPPILPRRPCSREVPLKQTTLCDESTARQTKNRVKGSCNSALPSFGELWNLYWPWIGAKQSRGQRARQPRVTAARALLSGRCLFFDDPTISTSFCPVVANTRSLRFCKCLPPRFYPEGWARNINTTPYSTAATATTPPPLSASPLET